MRLIQRVTLGAEAPVRRIFVGGVACYLLCRPAGPENPSSSLEALTNPRRITKPERQQINPRCLYAYTGSPVRLGERELIRCCLSVLGLCVCVERAQRPVLRNISRSMNLRSVRGV